MKFRSIDPTANLLDIYKILTPQDLLAASAEDVGVSAKNVQNILIDSLLPGDGSFVATKSVCEKIYGLLTQKKEDVDVESIKNILVQLDSQFQVASNEEGIKLLDFFGAATGSPAAASTAEGAKSYWADAAESYNKKYSQKGKGEPLEGLGSIVVDLAAKDTNAPYNGMTASVFNIKNPYCNPARRSVDQIDLFMNYIPTLQASQMVPFLDVQFEVEGVTKQGTNRVISQPSIVRFLYGSGEVSERNFKISPADEAMLQIIDPVEQAQKINSAASDTAEPQQPSGKYYAGTEMFLMPQTLSNMDRLRANGTSKIVDSKPFLPFASLESLNITIQNAGAGAIARKKGTLKLKIHDKARVVEMADFLRGPQGYGRSRAKIWTTYGWLAPQGRGAADAYSNFINTNMMTTDCWMVMNTQYTFDQTGQCSLQLDMVTQSSNKLQGHSINADPKVAAKMKEFEDVVSFIQKIKQDAGDLKGDAGDDMRPVQVLDAGAKGEFPDLKDVQKSISAVLSAIRSKGKIPESDISKLEENLKKLYVNKTSGGKTYKEELDDAIAAGIKNMLANAQKGHDPFLPHPSADGKQSRYFNEDLIKEVEKGANRKQPDTRGEKKKDEGSGSESKRVSTAKIEVEKKVVSFGKLFLNTVLPALLVNSDQDEIQVIFYSLNGNCGPLSNQTVAEIPINMRKFAYAYNDAMTTSMRNEMTIENFFNLLVNNQVSANDAIGYGMQEMYEPFDPANSEAKKIDESKFNTAMADWTVKYGTLTRPVVEMFIETGESNPSSIDPMSKLKRSRKTKESIGDTFRQPGSHRVMRIHVYDRTISPYDLVSQLIDTGDSWTLGKPNTRELENYASSLASANSAAVAKMTREQFYEYVKKKFKEDLGRDIDSEKTQSDYMSKPYDTTIRIQKGDRKAIRDYIALTVPTLRIGVNGSMISSANLASKTDGALAAANLMSAVNSAKKSNGTATPPVSGLEEASGIPLRMIPAQLTMTSLGCPIAQLYQQYFVDLQTGTSIDNLYNVTQITHDITPGKFTTNWTFMYTDGYGKFGAPPLMRDALTGAISKVFSQITAKPQAAQGASGAGGGKAGGGTGGGSGGGSSGGYRGSSGGAAPPPTSPRPSTDTYPAEGTIMTTSAGDMSYDPLLGGSSRIEPDPNEPNMTPNDPVVPASGYDPYAGGSSQPDQSYASSGDPAYSGDASYDPYAGGMSSG